MCAVNWRLEVGGPRDKTRGNRRRLLFFYIYEITFLRGLDRSYRWHFIWILLKMLEQFVLAFGGSAGGHSKSFCACWRWVCTFTGEWVIVLGTWRACVHVCMRVSLDQRVYRVPGKCSKAFASCRDAAMTMVIERPERRGGGRRGRRLNMTSNSVPHQCGKVTQERRQSCPKVDGTTRPWTMTRDGGVTVVSVCHKPSVLRHLKCSGCLKSKSYGGPGGWRWIFHNLCY